MGRFVQRALGIAAAAFALSLAACDAAVTAPLEAPDAMADGYDTGSGDGALSAHESAVGLARTIAASTVTASIFDLPSKIEFGTYEGSGEVVHPDVVVFPNGWNGHRYWSVLTPYPNSAVRYENPSLYTSEDGDKWTIPSGVTNPLARTRRGYLSDPDLVYQETTDELWLYYREVQTLMGTSLIKRHIADHIWLAKSSNGKDWTRPVRLASDTGRYVVSPSIVRTPTHEWRMFEVDAGVDGCSSKTSRVVSRRSNDGLKWSATTPVTLTQPGYQPWHLDVQYITQRGEYWALIAAYPTAQGCVATSLFLATSPDGQTWKTYPAPVLAKGAVPQFSAAVYRSTFAFTDAENVTLWFSGARLASVNAGKNVFAWTAAVAHTTASDIMTRITTTANSTPLPVTTAPGTMMMSANGVP